MQAVIICGGIGTRLKKVYKKTPKALIKINSIPNLQHIIKDLKKNNINKFLFLTSFQSNKIESYVKKIKLKNYCIVKDINLKGTGGALIGAYKKLDKEFLVIFSDLFMKINFKKFVIFSRKKKSEVNMFVHANSHPYDSDTVEYNRDCRVKKINLKRTNESKLNIAISGLFYFKKIYIKKFKYDNKKKINLDLVKDLISKKINHRIFAYKSIEYIKDFGTPKRLKKVNFEQKQSNRKKISAVFLDRDGVINKEIGGVTSKEEFIKLPKVEQAIKKLNQKQIPVFIVSNQAVLSKGKINNAKFKSIISFLDKLLSKSNAYIDDYLYCPFYKNKKYDISKIPYYSKYRKPNPGMILELSKKYRINLKNSFFVGDSDKDILAGTKVGCKTILVKSNKLFDYKYKIKPNFFVDNLSEAINIILK